MRRFVPRFSLGLLALALAGCASVAPGPEKDKTYNITILHTNDHHGHFWKNSDGEYGLSAQKTVVDQVRAEVKASGGSVLLLSGGDINTGVPESDLQNAVPDFEGMNLLKFDAMAVGNHEFDKPRAVLDMQRKLVHFPMLSANIYDHGQRMFAPYQVFNVGGVRIGVMGLTTEDTYKLVHPDNVQGVEFRSVIAEAQKVVPELRSQADVVIAATHMGHYVDGQHGSQAEGDVEMARAVSGIDLVVGGHSQNPVCMQAENVRDEAYVPGTPCAPDRQNGTWIVQAHEWGKYVGRADFTYRNGEFKLVHYALIPINLKKTVTGADGKPAKAFYTSEIAEDAAMLAMLTPYQAKGQAQLNVPVGSSDARIEGDRSVIRAQPAAMGVLVGLSMMDKTKADFAVVNAGGVRDSLPAGPLSYKDVLKVQPFGNTIVTVDLSGAEVMDYLNATAKMSVGSGAFPQFTGVRLVITAGVVSSASIQGAPIDPAKTYRMAINAFQAVGGDGYPKLLGHKGYVDSGFVDADVLRGFITARSPLKAADYAPGDAVLRK
ncbi:bifunctional UDP-sugar hydrolase/5'-nucleotidase UshA [Rhodoferax sp.]|uniref:bifunctional UDP-sugar hydrolase/5'-nucleotidase UshA n=1 Tax=Rhodoferax sp. TaxID=50421 RepID=UPI00374D20DF